MVYQTTPFSMTVNNP